MGREAVITHRKLRAALHLHARAIAIVPGLGRVGLDLAFPLQLGVAQQRFTQDSALDLQLRRVAGVLVMTAAAVSEVWTLGFYPVRRGLEHLAGRSAGKA